MNMERGNVLNRGRRSVSLGVTMMLEAKFQTFLEQWEMQEVNPVIGQRLRRDWLRQYSPGLLPKRPVSPKPVRVLNNSSGRYCVLNERANTLHRSTALFGKPKCGTPLHYTVAKHLLKRMCFRLLRAPDAPDLCRRCFKVR
jgi:hypothetical protein